MKIGSYLVKGQGSAEDRLRVMRDAGFDYICLSRSLFTGKGATPAMCERLGMEYDNIHLTCDNTSLIWFDTLDGEAIADRYVNEIRMAAEAGVHTGIVHVTWKRTPVPPDDPTVGYSRYARIEEAANKYDFRIAVENSAYEKQLFAVLDHHGAPFYHCFDCGHRSCFTPQIDYLAKYGDRLIATHIHDNNGVNDHHLLPFDGIIDWEDLAARYAAVPLTRERICAEFSGAGRREYPGLTRGEIAADVARTGIAGTRFASSVVPHDDGTADFYGGIPYPELIGELYARMRRLADMIGKAAENRQK